MNDLDFCRKVEQCLTADFGLERDTARPRQIYLATVSILRQILLNRSLSLEKAEETQKKVSYLCMEFLVGKMLESHLRAMGLYEDYCVWLAEAGQNFDAVAAEEQDPGIGNGGLGRLAACFMDSLAALDYPAAGYSLCYEEGLFCQKVPGGEQVELPDTWLYSGEAWLTPRDEKTVAVRFGGKVKETWRQGKVSIHYEGAYTVLARPYDLFIPGYHNDAALPIHLWRVVPEPIRFSPDESRRDWDEHWREQEFYSKISGQLYPDDTQYEGKKLRVCQQYFLVSATLQNLISAHLSCHASLDDFAEYNAIHINDTHPALAIPELMRLLMDEHGYDWDHAWTITVAALSYTNHTVMPEALECWPRNLLSETLPRIVSILEEINRRLTADLSARLPREAKKVAAMSLEGDGMFRMANLAVVGSHTVNGVSQIHSQILRERVFSDFASLNPEKFTNVTNGIAHRRWLCQSNPRLTALITETIGDGFISNPTDLERLYPYADNPDFRHAFADLRRKNKADFSDYVAGVYGRRPDPDSIFDVQIKRLHEYKRQLLNALRILGLYHSLKENPEQNFYPQTFFFAAKAAPGYRMAKRILKLLWCLGEEIARDKAVRDRLSLVFLPDYNVSLAQRIIPAADISQQISTAGKEASGTGNMKLMLNGAITLGTLDGANVEILEAVGKDNIFIFGKNEKEVEALLRAGYDPRRYLLPTGRPKDAAADTAVVSAGADVVDRALQETLSSILDHLEKGIYGENFSDLAAYLKIGYHSAPDPYLCLCDYADYDRTAAHLKRLYADPERWFAMATRNVAMAGRFSSDISIRRYAERIWKIQPLPASRK